MSSAESSCLDPSSKAGDILDDGVKLSPLKVFVDLGGFVGAPMSPKTLPITGSLSHPSISPGAISNSKITPVVI